MTIEREQGAISASSAVSGVVGYASAGNLLIVGPMSRVRPATEALATLPHCTALITQSDDVDAPPDWLPSNVESRCYYGTIERIEGYLGRYEVEVISSSGAVGNPRTIDGARYFDMVLDLTDSPVIRSTRLPPGYFAPGRDARSVDAAIVELRELVGEFEKPVYIRYSPDLCAHGASGLSGCTKCLDACPAGAIRSIGERIEIDTHLCHGIGACTSACPSGAIDYIYPERPDLLAAIAKRLEGATPGQALLLHGAALGERLDGSIGQVLPDWALPLEVEEVAAVGPEAWLTALAYGADQVILLAERDLEAPARDVINAQLAWIEPLLTALGDGTPRVVLQFAGAGGMPGEIPGPPVAQTGDAPRHFSLSQDKRTTLWFAIDALWQRAGSAVQSVALPSGAPLGELTFDAAACTLCMACVSVCPAKALHAGGDTPRLAFVEQNCLQCSLCVVGCPEKALELSPRMLFDSAARRRQRTLKEERPFECIECGKPFASPSAINMMVEKLKDHSMFQGGRINQLKMCEDCRVRAIFSEQEHDSLTQEPRL